MAPIFTGRSTQRLLETCGTAMAIRKIPLRSLLVNRANDRHGELENETSAIAWLFKNREVHMRNLAKDITKSGELYELPLVSPEGTKFVVFDGNRRITCLKLLEDPKRAPTMELQLFFRDLRATWIGKFLDHVQCQVESDRDKIDEILFRRHTGTQNGVGQSTWDGKIKTTFMTRTGKGGGINVADEIERRLEEAELLPSRRKIPRSNMNRLLSAEPFRNRLGFTIIKGRFEFTHSEKVVLAALARVTDDLVSRKLVLADIWDVDGKRRYLDGLERDAVLPTVKDALVSPTPGSQVPKSSTNPTSKPTAPMRPTQRHTLIPHKEYGLTWPGRLQRHHQIWEELQFHLELNRHPNAISVLLRVLLELSIENYIRQTNMIIPPKDSLATRMQKVGADLTVKGEIDKQNTDLIKKFNQFEQLVSSDTLNRYVHSPTFAPSPEHLVSVWDSLSEIIVLCLEV